MRTTFATRETRLAGAAVCALVLALVAGGAAATDGRPTLGHPGYLILAGAADSTAGYHWQAGPGPDQRSLVWPDGVLTVPRPWISRGSAAGTWPWPWAPG